MDFKNTSQSGIFGNAWDKDADGTVDATTSDYTTRWSVPSTQQECLKLRAENCLGLDSSQVVSEMANSFFTYAGD